MFVQTGTWQDCDPASGRECIAYEWDPETWEPVAWHRWSFDYRLQAGSPAIDAGTSEGAPAFDMDGNGRPCGKGVDMGAHEAGVCAPAGAKFVRGDPDATGETDITDALFILDYLFLGGPAPSCVDAADSDDNAALQITDAVYLLGFLFLDGPTPREPFEACGTDSTPDPLGCASFEACE